MTKLEEAIRDVRRMPRFRYRGLTIRHRIGPFIPQLCIPIAKRKHVVEADRIAGPNGSQRNCKVRWIEVAAIRSEQKCLRFDKLLWHLRRYAEMQRKRRPMVIMVRDIPILWDGNHRVTSALLLEKRKIRCDVFFS